MVRLPMKLLNCVTVPAFVPQYRKRRPLKRIRVRITPVKRKLRKGQKVLREGLVVRVDSASLARLVIITIAITIPM